MEVVNDPSLTDMFHDGELNRLVESYAQTVRDDNTADSGRESSGPDEAVFDHAIADGESSPGTSHPSDDDLSELAESRRTSYVGNKNADPITPTKHRSAFRNASSVREMQLDLTPPHLMSSSQYHKYRLNTASRNSTPKSTRSYHSGPRSARSSPTKSQKKEFPLVLLHITLLPVACPYSEELMEAMLPPHVIENWKLLREKVPPTVIDRGILIPHPREDYDLLEERLLETLELKSPRILKCGHFHLTAQEQADIEESEDEYESDGEYELCKDCGRRIREGSFGAGSGDRRWSIKVYASNGLMKAGAWGAAWREMERVDVEILPWIEDELRRQLDLRQDEEMRQQMEERAIPESPQTMDEERRREIYGETARANNDVFSSDTYSHPTMSVRGGEVPLSTLLSNFLQHLLQDRKNVVIAFMSLFILHLAFRMGPTTDSAANTPLRSQTTVQLTTVTATATSVSTSTVYQVTDTTTIVQSTAIAAQKVEIAMEVNSDETKRPLVVEDWMEMPVMKEVGKESTVEEVVLTPAKKEVIQVSMHTNDVGETQENEEPVHISDVVSPTAGNTSPDMAPSGVEEPSGFVNADDEVADIMLEDAD